MAKQQPQTPQQRQEQTQEIKSQEPENFGLKPASELTADQAQAQFEACKLDRTELQKQYDEVIKALTTAKAKQKAAWDIQQEAWALARDAKDRETEAKAAERQAAADAAKAAKAAEAKPAKDDEPNSEDESDEDESGESGESASVEESVTA